MFPSVFLTLFAAFAFFASVSSIELVKFNTPYQKDVTALKTYMKQCAYDSNHENYVNLILYSCLTADTMEEIVTFMKRFKSMSTNFFGFKPRLYLQLMGIDCFDKGFVCTKIPDIECEDRPLKWIPQQDTNGIFNRMTVTLCNSYATCLKANQNYQEMIKLKGNVPTVVDIRNLQPYGDPNTINFDTADITKYFMCGNDQGAPVPYLKTSTSTEVKCGCVCAPGSEVKVDLGGGKTCVPVKDPPRLCKDMCYEYNAQDDDYVNGKFVADGDKILKRTNLHVNVPDNYVNYYTNYGQPQVTLELFRNPYNYQTSKLSLPKPGSSVTTESSEWREFATDPSAEFAKLPFRGEGLYQIVVRATDYVFEDSCYIDIAIQDKRPPISEGNCPADDPPTTKLYTYSGAQYAPYADAKKDLSDFYNWIKSIINAANGKCPNSKEVYTATSFGNNSPVSIPESEITTCLDIKGKDMAKLRAESKLLSANPIANYPFGLCSKKCKLYKDLDKRILKYDCDKDIVVDDCISGETCDYHGAISLIDPSFLFTGVTSIGTKTKQETKEAVDHLELQNSYDPNTDIHFINPCECLDTDVDCRKKIKVSNLLNVATGYATSPFATALAATGPASQYVSARYQIDSGKWLSFDSGTVHELKRLVQTLVVELRTPCGLLKSKTFTLYQHPHHALKLCYALEKSSFYQISKGKSGMFVGDTLLSFPKSDFAEFTFTFDHKKADLSPLNGYAGYKSFDSITCEVYHGANDGQADTGSPPGLLPYPLPQTKPVQIISETKEIVLEHYAVRLVRNLTTARYTPVGVNCTIKYNGFDSYVYEEECSREFRADDDESPWIDVFDGQNGVETYSGTCGIDCKDKDVLVPNSVCGGNIIDYEQDPVTKVGKTVFYPRSDADQSCCQDCGEASCDYVFEEAIGIKKCTLANPPATKKGFLLAVSPTEFMRNYGLFAFMTAGVAVTGAILSAGMIALRYHRTRRAMTANEAYSPLI